MQHESMPHFMRLKLLMIFMDLFSLVTVASQTTMELGLWVRHAHYTDRKEALSDCASLRSWEVGSIHPWLWTNLFTPSSVLNIVPWSQALMGAQIWMSNIYCHLSQIKANQTPHLHHAGHAAATPLSLSHLTEGNIYGFRCIISLHRIIINFCMIDNNKILHASSVTIITGSK